MRERLERDEGGEGRKGVGQRMRERGMGGSLCDGDGDGEGKGASW